MDSRGGEGLVGGSVETEVEGERSVLVDGARGLRGEIWRVGERSSAGKDQGETRRREWGGGLGGTRGTSIKDCLI